ncbi:MAG: PspC domain-containing protein [Flavobacteriales bacterium]|nr:PspC domain-containing protein [Flavobacteriales bacterium]
MKNGQLAEGKILGVCAWIAAKLSLDVKLVRLIFIVATIVGFGSPIIVYFTLYIVMKLMR